MSPLVSIILPIYNSEKYLRKCLHSLLDQTYDNYEIIIVDDGSTDSSLNICYEYANNDKSVKVYHKENGGVSSARNMGLDYARGEFVMFTDADDIVSENYISNMVQVARDQAIVICNYTIMDDKNSLRESGENLPNKVWDNIKGFAYNIIVTRSIFGSVCRVLFPLEIIRKNNIKFANCRLAEDQLFLLNVIAFCNSIVTLKDILYFYCINQNSATHQKYKVGFLNDRETYLNQLINISSLYNFNKDELDDITAFAFLRERKNVFFNAALSPEYKKEYRQCQNSFLFKTKIKLSKRIKWMKSLSRQDLFVAICLDLHIIRAVRFIRLKRVKTTI
jgi:glycosyltransferase involved in cell wall biosynthesis